MNVYEGGEAATSDSNFWVCRDGQHYDFEDPIQLLTK